MQLFDQPLHRLSQSALHRRHRHQWQLTKHLARTHLPGNDLFEDTDGFPASLIHIHVRVCVVANQAIGLFGHFLGNVGVQVECHDQWHLRTHEISHTTDDHPLRILVIVGNHRPVQVQHHTIAWPRGTDTFKQQPHHVLERGLFHATGWLGSHIDNRFDLDPSGSRLVQIATVNCARTQVHLPEQISALKVITAIAVALEITQRRWNGGECVCFVLDSSTDNSHFTPHTTQRPQELDTNEQMGHQLPPIPRTTLTRQPALDRSPQCGRQQ